MSAEYIESTLSQIRETISRLQNPVSDMSELLSLLSAPLDAIGLLPPAFRRYNTRPLHTDANFQIHKHVPLIQAALLLNITPSWQLVLKEKKLDSLLYQYFCPDSFFSATQAARDVAINAYGSLLSSPLHAFSLDVLSRLNRHYPIDRLHSVIFSKTSSIPSHRKMTTWEDLVRSVVSVPTKVANYFGANRNLHNDLTAEVYNTHLCHRYESLTANVTQPPNPGKLSYTRSEFPANLL